MGGAISGGDARRDCSEAWSAILRQRSAAFYCCRSQMRVRATRDYGHDLGHTQFRAFLDRPFQAVEFEDGQEQRDIERGRSGYFLSQFELHPAFPDGHNTSAPYNGTDCNIEFLSYASAQDADQMIGVVAGEGGVIG